jgi:hypothetical protein
MIATATQTSVGIRRHPDRAGAEASAGASSVSGKALRDDALGSDISHIPGTRVGQSRMLWTSIRV